MTKTKILVATHKHYQMPKGDLYLPIHVGKEGKSDLGYQGDNTGENISNKNSSFCELTGLFWAWKNFDCDYIGLCHYRRYFTTKSLLTRFMSRNNKFDLILNEEDVNHLMSKYDVIVPKKRNYYIENIWTHYQNAHEIKDLEETREIIEEMYPSYVSSFDEVMSGKTLHLYNMFVMKKKDFNRYSEWVFSILFELEKRTDISDYDAYQSRIYGFISERLFNVWLTENKELAKAEITAMNMENIKWVNKIIQFLKRKAGQK